LDIFLFRAFLRLMLLMLLARTASQYRRAYIFIFYCCGFFIHTYRWERCGYIVYCLCVCVCVFIRLRISPPRIKLAASHFAQRFIGVQGRESHILGNFAPPEAQNRTNRPARRPRLPACKHYRRDAPT